MPEDASPPSTPRFAFLLGAGCSRGAGVPAMAEFTEQFRSHISTSAPELLSEVDELLGVMSAGRKGDLEDLMRALEFVAELTTHAETAKRLIPAWKNERKAQAEVMFKRLQAFIVQKTFVNDVSRVTYLQELAELIFDYGPISFFTVNYDTCLDLLLTLSQIDFTDGFEPFWDSRLLSAKSKVRVYKLHGSCLWYSSGAQYVKIPIRPSEGSFELLGGGSTQAMLIYPTASKARLSEPLAVLLGEFRKALLELDVLFIVGYSGRDEEIATVLAEALRVNGRLSVYVVSRHPRPCIEQLAGTDPGIRRLAIPISATWESMLGGNKIARIVQARITGTEGYLIKRQKERLETFVQEPSYNLAGILRESFDHLLLRESFLAAKRDLDRRIVGIRESRQPLHSMAECSLGLLYYSFLMGQTDNLVDYKEALLAWLDFHAAERRDSRTAEELIGNLPIELNQDFWNSGQTFRLSSLTEYPFRQWSEWVRPFVENEVFDGNLRQMAEGVRRIEENQTLLNAMRDFFNSPRDGRDKLEPLSRVKGAREVMAPRFDGLPTVEELAVLPTGSPEALSAAWGTYGSILGKVYAEARETLVDFMRLINDLDRPAGGVQKS